MGNIVPCVSVITQEGQKVRGAHTDLVVVFFLAFIDGFTTAL